MCGLIDSEQGDNRPILFGLDHQIRLLRQLFRDNRTLAHVAHSQDQLENAAACPQLWPLSSQRVQILALLIMNR